MANDSDTERDALMAAETRTVVGGTRAPEASIPASIDRYHIVGRIGEGGMGVVYEAIDPDLKRRVAVKVVRGRAGLIREAQAMAQLSHPSVVPVFDVGVLPDGDGVFIAMELVEGETLRDWLKAEKRPWKQVVTKLVAAGRGLAAAHAAGIVHRDFKPANVLVGMDGRVRVTDFGLARVDETIDGAPVKDGETGIAGTPGYVAPEALDGVIDARVDQFAFCVSFYEALYGERPFDAGSGSGRSPLIAMAEEAKRTGVKPAPRGRDVPGWLRAMIVRGLDADPARRWPSVTALLDAIERVPRRRRLTIAIMGGAVSLAAVSALLLLARGEPASPSVCTRAAEHMTGVWDDDARRRLADSFVAADPVIGASQAELTSQAFDARAKQWIDLHTASCRATHVEGSRSPEALDLRMQCLERRRNELAATVAVLVDEPDRELVHKAVRMAARLAPLEYCTDDAALSKQSRLPEDPERRAQVIDLDRRLSDAYAEYSKGDFQTLLAPVDQLVSEARALAHPGMIGRAVLLRAFLHQQLQEWEPAAAAFREAAQALARSGDNRMEATAWLSLVNILGYLKLTPQASEVLAAAEAAVARAGDPLELRVDYLFRAASWYYATDEFDKVLENVAAARKLLEPEGGPPVDDFRHSNILILEAQTRYAMGSVDGVEALADRAIAMWVARYGADHPDVANGHSTAGVFSRYAERFDEARRHHEESLRIRLKVFGADHPIMVDTENDLALTLVEAGELEAAVPHAERALTAARKHFQPGSRQLTMTMVTYGELMKRAGRDADALAVLDEVIAMQRALPKPEREIVHALSSRATTHMRAQRNELALADYLAELAARDELLGADHPDAMRPLVGAAQALLRMARPKEALPLLERAVEIGDRHADPQFVTRARYTYGKALVEAKVDRRRGLELVRGARARFVELNALQDLEVVDAWLAEAEKK